MVSKLLIAGFLLAHGAIHAGFISPRPVQTAGGPAWPFELDRSWVLGPLGVDSELARVIGAALVVITLVAFGVAALAAVGIVPGAMWPIALAVGAITSLALLALFFHPWLVIGAVIDVVVLWAVLVTRWAPEGITP